MAIRTLKLGVNCYLIERSEGFALIDTGMPAQRRRLDEALARAGCSQGDLRLILLTHGDVDHVGNSAYLRRQHGALIGVHAGDVQMVRSGDMASGRKDRPDRHSPVFRVLTGLIGWVERLVGAGPGFETFEPDLLLEDGQSLAPFGLEAQVLHLPGHSSGSIGVLTAQGDLFCGDLFANFRRPGLHFLIDDLPAARASQARLAELGVERVYPGHGRPFPIHKLPQTVS